MEKISNQWMKQKGTLMGKVIVINILMESLFVYQLNCLNNILESLCK